MSKYKHGIKTSRTKTEGIHVTKCRNMIQVVIGTAPVNTLENPRAAVNNPIVLESMEDAEKKLGVSASWEKYTLLHSVYASFKKHAVAPVIMINVLDPGNESHVEAVVGSSHSFINKRIVIEEDGILRDAVLVSDSDTTYKEEEDYVVSFDANGYLVIAAASDGALASKESVTISYAKLNPESVTESEIIGGLDAVTGEKTGIAVIDDVYPKTGYIPEIILAPVYSKSPAVAAALDAMAQNIFGIFNGITLVDMDTKVTGADLAKIAEVKEKNVPASRWTTAFWPMVKADGYTFAYSAFAGALLQARTAENNNIPSESPDNLKLLIDGICTEDGTNIYVTQDDINDYMNACGVVGAIKLPEWKAWGNNTAAYPDSEDPIDRWIKSVTMLNYLENMFKRDYLSKIGRNTDYKFIEGIVSEFNMNLNALTPDYLAGGEIVFNRSENPKEKILHGHLKFKTRYADYIPTEFIENEFTYDVAMLEAALEGSDA